MLRIRLSDIKPTKTSHKMAKSGATIRHLHLFGIKYFGIWRKWSMFKSLMTCKK